MKNKNIASHWDASNATNFSEFGANTVFLDKLDLSQWNTSEAPRPKGSSRVTLTKKQMRTLGRSIDKMRQSLLLALLFPFLLFGQGEINKPERATYFTAYDSTTGIYHIGVTLPDQVTTTGQPNLTAAADELEFLSQTDALPIEYTPLPDEGQQVETGIYEYEGKLVIARQAHIRTGFAPEDTPALFAVYRPNGPDVLEWVGGELVYVGNRRIYNGQLYEVVQQHMTLAGQTPDLIPALWNAVSNEECPDWVQPTGAQDAYPIGACVTHNGQCWESMIDANTTTPETTVFNWWVVRSCP